MTTPDAPLAARRLAGYRVLRSLARDDDAELLLGFRDAGDGKSSDAGPDTGSGSGSDTVGGADVSEPSIVALKVVPSTPQRWSDTIDALEALERASGEHVVRLLDVDADDEALCLVFERLPNGSLADVLALRERVDAGEVVTIVAPLVEALHRMHLAGVAHGVVGARTVMFRADGEPVLMGFGSSSLFPPGSPEVVLELQHGVGADRRAIRELACLLLGRVVGPRARAARALVAELELCPEEFVLGVLSRRLFEIAAAVPVRFIVDEAEPVTEAVRVVPLGAPVDVEGGSLDEQGTARGRGVMARWIPDAWAQRVLDGIDGSPFAPVLATAGRHWRSWSPRRRRVAVAATVGLVALSGALAIVPSAPPDAANAAQAPSTAARGAPSPSSSRPGSSSAQSPGAARDSASALAGDDPLAAATVLVATRERCIRSLSRHCLDGVDQPDSGALRDDREAIGAAQQGGELPDPLVEDVSLLAPELVERLGDSALVRLTVAPSGSQATPGLSANPDATATPRRAPASLLLVKGEAGWRIRDVIAAPGGSS